MEQHIIDKLTSDFENLRECYLLWLHINLECLFQEKSITEDEFLDVIYNAYESTIDPDDFIDFIKRKHELYNESEILNFLYRLINCM